MGGLIKRTMSKRDRRLNKQKKRRETVPTRGKVGGGGEHVRKGKGYCNPSDECRCLNMGKATAG